MHRSYDTGVHYTHICVCVCVYSIDLIGVYGSMYIDVFFFCQGKRETFCAIIVGCRLWGNYSAINYRALRYKCGREKVRLWTGGLPYRDRNATMIPIKI